MDLKSFYKYTKIQPTAYCDHIFNRYNNDQSRGFITFRDFVICLWNYCTLSVPNIVDYVFSVYDADGSKDIDLDEAKNLITDMYGEKYMKNPEAKRCGTRVNLICWYFLTYKDYRVLDELNRLRDVESIKLEVFHHFNKMNPSLLKPAYDLQKQIRSHVINDEFWMIYSKKRVEIYGVKRLLQADEVLSTIPRRNIPPTPQKVKEQNKPKSNIDTRPKTPPEKGSKAWKEQKMSKHNQGQKYEYWWLAFSLSTQLVAWQRFGRHWSTNKFNWSITWCCEVCIICFDFCRVMRLVGYVYRNSPGTGRKSVVRSTSGASVNNT